jgi:hypothetical protein
VAARTEDYEDAACGWFAARWGCAEGAAREDVQEAQGGGEEEGCEECEDKGRGVEVEYWRGHCGGVGVVGGVDWVFIDYGGGCECWVSIGVGADGRDTDWPMREKLGKRALTCQAPSFKVNCLGGNFQISTM